MKSTKYFVLDDASVVMANFSLFEGNQIMVSDRDVKKMQEDGWELAGK